ncbi:MAG: prolyl oligopeptidase family serine peptidase [Rhodobacteraceae bacterium]|nr:prolyl oligopeptidase family serine peptidase [Paracoccaceae bacterium]
MKLNYAIPAAIVALAFTTSADAAGYFTTHVEAAHRDRPLEAHVWYPNEQDGYSKELGKNPVFVGVPVEVDASPLPGPHPVVVLSHGSGGNAVNISWIGAHLADRGMIVIATNHPGTTSRDSTPEQTLKIWERPADISALIDFAAASLSNSHNADLNRVASLGFSLGGYTALAVAGAEVSQADYVSYCMTHPNMLDCSWFSQAGINLEQDLQAGFEGQNADPRVKVTVAVDPALAQAYTDQSLTGVNLPVLIINLGSQGTIPPGINGTGVAKRLPFARYETIEEATHFSFLGLCTKIGEQIIASEGEEPICTEYGSRDRADIHNELKSTIAGFLAENL